MTELHIRDWKQDGHRKRQVSDLRVPSGHLGCLAHTDRMLQARDTLLEGPRECFSITSAVLFPMVNSHQLWVRIGLDDQLPRSLGEGPVLLPVSPRVEGVGSVGRSS